MPKPLRSNRLRTSPTAGAAKPRDWEWVVDWIVGAGLVLLVAVAYLQVFRFEFVNYDDTFYVPDNPHVRAGFSLGGIGWAFTTFETANWYPLSWLSLMLDCQMFGPRPGGHHLVNVVLHAANAVLLFIVLRRMSGSRWRSAAVAALFAVHPLHVESVAWVAERKDVLSTWFFLLTLLAYHRYTVRPNFGRWIMVFLAMALGLMAKSMLVTLPAVLLLLDFWPLRQGAGSGERGVESNDTETRGHGDTGMRENLSLSTLSASSSPLPAPRSPLPALLPLLALSLATAAVTLAAQANKGATTMLYGQAGLPLRLVNAAIAYVKYLAMTLWPTDLAVYYPYNFHPSALQAAGAVFLLLVLTVAALWSLRQSSRHSPNARYFEPAAVGWLWYLGTLVPVIGLVQVGSQAMADRYCYIPSIGLFLAIVWTVGDLARWLPWAEPKRRIVLAGATSAMLTVLLVLTHHQASFWINSERLFRHALAITGENPVACENLGDALLHQGKYLEAETQFRQVLAMDAEHYRQTPPELAQALAGQGRIDQAIAFIHETIPENSEKAAALNNLALFLAPRGRVAPAIRLFQEAIQLAPQEPAGLKNLAWIYATCPDRRFRNGPMAIELARRACELSGWKNARYRQTLADAYLAAGDVDHAIEELREVVRLDPTDRAAAGQLESIVRQRR